MPFTDVSVTATILVAFRRDCCRATTETLSHAILVGQGSTARQSSGLELLTCGGCLEKSRVRVLLVDDYEPWRSFASRTLQEIPELQVVSEATDGLEAVQIAQLLQPDLILLDIGLPTLNGIEAARRMRQVSSTSKILFMSENRSIDIANEAMSTGAAGYVVKSDAASELLPAVRAVLEGGRFLSASLAAHGYGARRNEQTATISHSHEVEFYAMTVLQ